MDLSERRDVDVRRHPWEVARARFFRRLIARHVDVGTLGAVLDVGAGDGWFAGELADDVSASCRITCWDVNYSDADLHVPAHLGGRIMRTTEPPEGTFDLILLLDVIEHIAKDEQFLRDEITPRMHARSRLVVSVPAYQALFGDHDRMLEHRRRYRPAVLRATVGRHLRIIDQGSLFTSLLLPRLVQAGLERAGRHGDATGVGAWTGGPRLTALLERVLLADAAAGRRLGRWGWPVPGLSTWVVAVGAQS